MKKGRASLGLDLSTQGVSAVVLDVDSQTRIFEHSLDYRKDPRLSIFGIREEDYILPPTTEGEASQPPAMFFAALDAIFTDLKAAINPEDIVVINSSAQQHGHVYLNRQAHSIFQGLTGKTSADSDLVILLKGSLAYDRAPIWMTSDTEEEAEFIRDQVGGKEREIALSGSDVPLRFTGVVMRKIARQFPEVYDRTENIQLLSSLVPAILTGNSKTPIDYGNACGMSLMDYRRKCWSGALVRSVASGLPGGETALLKKLPLLVAPDAVVGNIAAYFVRKYGFSPGCRIAAGSGDNPQSKVLVAGDLLSLGSSIVNMVSTDGQTLDMNGLASAMYDGTGRPFIFGCRTNGAMVWDRLRAMYGLKKEEHGPAESSLRETPVAQNLVFWQPREESFPPSGKLDMVRIGKETPGLGTDYAGLIETTLTSVYHHSKDFTGKTSGVLYVTGGARKSLEIIRRVAAIWNRPVTPIEEGGAALGAAVAGASAFLKSEGDTPDMEEFIGEGLLKREPTVLPEAEDVLVFHRPGGYLDRFTAAKAKLLSG
ncbi:MAG: FGGY family carbohydrate kinase [Dehalococcoidia bacterium]|jgi:xylulokinase